MDDTATNKALLQPGLDHRGRILPPSTDFARSCPIRHDSPTKPHDSLTILYDSHTKTRDFCPKLNDKLNVMSNI